MSDTEIISDDDVAVVLDQVIDLDKIENDKSVKSRKIETIIIDDEKNSQSDNNNVTNNGNTLDVYTIYSENKLLADFIEKCINLDNTDAMMRIINRTLLKVYNDTDKGFRHSAEFEKILQRQINLLETEPHKKFSHITNIIQALTFSGVKKRVKLTTLATNLNNKHNKRSSDFGERNVKRSKFEIIDLDSEPNESIPIINLDEDPNEVIVLDEPAKTRVDDEKENMQIVNNGDVNQIDDHEHKNSQNDSEENNYLKARKEVFLPSNVSEQQSTVTKPVNRHMDHNGQIDGPLNYEISSEEEEQRIIQQEIKSIESQIENCKRIIQELDEEEVQNDNLTSPYIISDKFKAKIVSLYKKLCMLTGLKAVKKRTVRLQVQDGHPAGPVRRLEAFINRNIGEDGVPQFPDFRDVTICVLEANETDRLGWSKAQILNEANALFTQCGRALQKRRQKREWRDLLATVKIETLDYDPADEDPGLQAKLEGNRRIALGKEHELLHRYSQMQDSPTQANLNIMNPPQPTTQNLIRTVGSCENTSVQNEAIDIIMEIPSANKENDENIATNVDYEARNNSHVSNILQNPLVIIKTEVAVEFEPPENVETPDESKESLHLALKNGDYIPCSQRIQMEDSPIENDTSVPSSKIKTDFSYVNNANSSNCGLAAYSKNDLNDVDSDDSTNSDSSDNRYEENSQDDIFEKQHETDSLNSVCDSLVNNETNSLDKIKIKKEPVDVAALLDALGDKFTADIVDIQDPFLVIEISDSSDEED